MLDQGVGGCRVAGGAPADRVAVARARQDTPESAVDFFGRRGVTGDHRWPFQCSVTASSAPPFAVLEVTTKHELGVAQDIAGAKKPPLAWIGTIRQELPSQLSASSLPFESPMAWHEVALAQATAFSSLAFVPLRLGGSTMCQLPWVHRSENVRLMPSMPT